MKNIQLSIDKAKQLFGKNPELDEILRENFTEEELGLKKPLPKAWGGLGYIKGYYITGDTRIIKTANLSPLEENRNVFATEKQAESVLAYAQLTQLMKAYNGDWIPDWNNDHMQKYVILRRGGMITSEVAWRNYSFLSFKSEALCMQFMSNFSTLINQFYQI